MKKSNKKLREEHDKLREAYESLTEKYLQQADDFTATRESHLRLRTALTVIMRTLADRRLAEAVAENIVKPYMDAVQALETCVFDGWPR